MSCCGGSTVGRLIKDVDKLPDYLLADRDHIYRKPDKSMWVLNQDNTGYDPLNEDRVFHAQDTATVKHTWDTNAQTLKSDVQIPNLISSDAENAITVGNDGKLFVKQAHELYTIKFVQKITGLQIAIGTVLGQKVQASGKTFMMVRGGVSFDTSISSITPNPVTFDVLLENVDTGTTITGFDGYFSTGQSIVQLVGGGVAQASVILNTGGKTGEYLITTFDNTTTGKVTVPITVTLI